MQDVEANLVKHITETIGDGVDVCDRVYAGVTPPPGYSPGANGGAILIRQVGGTADYAGVLRNHSIQVECYGRDEADAVAIDMALREVMNNRRVCGGYVRIQNLGTLLYDPETQWRFVLSFYTYHVVG